MKQQILDILDSLKISYQSYDHAPTFRGDEARDISIPGLRIKSLLLKNKSKNKFFMVMISCDKKLDNNLLRKNLGESKLSFVSPELMSELIAVIPGHVSPYALINNSPKNIRVIFESELAEKEIGFHPLKNDSTIVSNMRDIERFLEYIGFEYEYMDLS